MKYNDALTILEKNNIIGQIQYKKNSTFTLRMDSANIIVYIEPMLLINALIIKISMVSNNTDRVKDCIKILTNLEVKQAIYLLLTGFSHTKPEILLMIDNSSYEVEKLNRVMLKELQMIAKLNNNLIYKYEH